jgi:predicted phosphodiesterase
MESYTQSIKDAFAGGLEQALRSHHIERLYLVTGGDLIHVDGPAGTTSGTPQDLLCSPAEAFAAAVELVVWCVDYARSLGIEVHVLTVMGNHDRTLSSAAGVAVQQRFHGADDVVSYPLQERVYTAYGQHLILATHGDLRKSQWKKLPSIMMAEARTLLASTRWQTVVSGHLHFQAADLMDDAGTLYAQGSSPSPTDAWHYQSGYVGSRKGIQMLLMEPDSCATSLMHQPV